MIGIGCSLPAYAEAQRSLRTPSRGGVAGEYARVSFGTCLDVNATLAGIRAVVSATFRRPDYDENHSGNPGVLRFAPVFGSPIQLCPTLGADFEQRTWTTVSSGALTANRLTGRAGPW